jgi:hypothetical protein
VSICEQKQIVGKFGFVELDGIVAKTYPHWSISTSSSPKALNSSNKTFPRFFCFSEEGKDVELGSAVVSI